MKKTVLIAGGSGLIGSGIKQLFESNGFEVFILSRSTVKDASIIKWNPTEERCDWNPSIKIDLLINLCGAGIADKRWTSSRKKELEDSRIQVTNFLFNWCQKNQVNIGRYIGASGVTAFPFDQDRIYDEHDTIEGGYLQELVGDWEKSHNQFQSITSASIVRIAPVIKANSGLIKKMSGIIKKGMGSYLGKGSQMSPWIHQTDLVHIFHHVDEHSIDGIVHGSAGNCTNKELTDGIAAVLKKKIWLPKVPSFILKLMFGELAEIMLGSLEVSSDKLKNTNFSYLYNDINEALRNM
jgi:uncharacterized protein (TIGR01777 family)